MYFVGADWFIDVHVCSTHPMNVWKPERWDKWVWIDPILEQFVGAPPIPVEDVTVHSCEKRELRLHVSEATLRVNEIRNEDDENDGL